MAARRRVRFRGVPIAVNLAPMIDVTFLLLIFFLVTTTFGRAEGLLASKLPQDRGRPVVALPISPIVVRLAQTGPGPRDCAISIDRFTREPANFGELVAVLREIRQAPGFDDQTPVVILPAQDVLWDHVVNCWNAALRAQCKNIAFGSP